MAIWVLESNCLEVDHSMSGFGELLASLACEQTTNKVVLLHVTVHIIGLMEFWFNRADTS